jgi:branched-chain amino acid transport system permease protein
MIGLASSVAVVYTRVIIDIAMYFGLFVIVAMALNFQYGNAGVPNMGCAVSASIGGYIVSSTITRIIFWVGTRDEFVGMLPFSTAYDWNYNNQRNTYMMNDYIAEHAFFGISMLLLSLALGFVAGWALGYIISLPAIRLRATYLIITLITMADAAQILGRNIVWISGGTLGMFVPNVFAWYPGDRTILTAVITMSIGLVCYFILRSMLNSPYGRLMRAVRENDLTVNSVGKDVIAIRRNVLMFASGITAVLGVMVAYYYSFVIETNYIRATWTYWPWLMLMVGGPGNNAGTFIGCALIIAMRRLIIVFKWALTEFIWYPIVIFEQQLLAVLLLIVMVFRPDGLIPEKLLRIPGIDYRRLTEEETQADWRVVRRDPDARTGILSRLIGAGKKKSEEAE